MGKRRKEIHTGNFTMDAAKNYLYKRISQITPNVYAAFALALSERGWSTEDISELFAQTQVIWQDALTDGRDMVQICSDELDIDVRSGHYEEDTKADH